LCLEEIRKKSSKKRGYIHLKSVAQFCSKNQKIKKMFTKSQELVPKPQDQSQNNQGPGRVESTANCCSPRHCRHPLQKICSKKGGPNKRRRWPRHFLSSPSATTVAVPEEEKPPTTGSSPSSHGPMTFIQAYKARATIALSGIASTIVVPSRGKTKTTPMATTSKTATTIPTSGKGDASPPYDVDRDKTTENKGIDDAEKSTMHEVAPVNGWSFKTSNCLSGRAFGGGGLNRAASTAASGGTSGGGGGQERRKGITRGGSFGGLACWAWVVPWVLLVLGGVEGMKGVAIPDCTYAAYEEPGCTSQSCYNARTCGIRQAVDAYIAGSTEMYGPIEDWNTSLVTDMSRVFQDKSSFNSDISAWQVGKVTNMHASTYILFFFPLLSKIWVSFGCFFFPSVFLFCASTNSIFEQCSLLFFLFQPIFILGLFFVAVVQCFVKLVPSMVISPPGRSGK
jgi:surface protein